MARMLFSFTCPQCGTVFNAARRTAKFCSYACASRSYWKEGGYQRALGYKILTREGKTQLEHRAIAEKALGRPLPVTAVVHHWGNKGANKEPWNLVICENQAYHNLLHARQRRLQDVGSFDLKRCAKCKSVKPVGDFPKASREWDKKDIYCKPCRVEMRCAYLHKIATQARPPV